MHGFIFFLTQQSILQVLHTADILESILHQINNFTFLQFWNGLAVIFSLAILKTKKSIYWLILVLLSYEIITLPLEFYIPYVFQPESLSAKLTDVLLGIAGGLTGQVILSWDAKKKSFNWLITNIPLIFSFIAISFLWAGYFQHQYNCFRMNPLGMNLWLYSIFLLSIFPFRSLYLLVGKTISKPYFQILLIWAAYVVLMTLFEFFGFCIFSTTGSCEQKFAFSSLIQGNDNLLICFCIFPFTVLLLHKTYLKVSMKVHLKILTSHEYSWISKKTPTMKRLFHGGANFIYFLFVIYILFLIPEFYIPPMNVEVVKSDNPIGGFNLKTGDLLVRPNWNWLPGSSTVEDGRVFGHMAIVIRGAEGKSVREVLAKAVVIESLLFDQVTRRYILGSKEIVRKTPALTSFGERFKGRRYLLRMELDDTQRQFLVQFLNNQLENDYYSVFLFKKNISFPPRSPEAYLAADLDQWNCVTLSWYAFQYATGKDLDDNLGTLVYPNDIIRNVFFNAPGDRILF